MSTLNNWIVLQTGPDQNFLRLRGLISDDIRFPEGSLVDTSPLVSIIVNNLKELQITSAKTLNSTYRLGNMVAYFKLLPDPKDENTYNLLLTETEVNPTSLVIGSFSVKERKQLEDGVELIICSKEELKAAIKAVRG